MLIDMEMDFKYFLVVTSFMEIEHVIFDFHGSLEDLMKSYAHLYRSALKNNGVRKNGGELEDFYYRTAGMHLSDQLRHFLPRYDEGKIKSLCNEFDESARKLPLKPFEKTVEVITKLGEKGKKLYVTTTIPQKYIDERIERMGLSEYFELILGGNEDVKKHGYDENNKSHIDLMIERSGEKKGGVL